MAASPQWHGGSFHNPLPVRNGSLLKMLARYWNRSTHATPDLPLPVCQRRAADFSQPPTSGLRVTWLGHSSVLIEIGGKRLLCDPVWGRRVSPVSWLGPTRFFAPPLALEDLPPLDAVLLTHDHYDHLDRETIRLLRDRVPLFVTPLGVGAWLERWGVRPERIIERDWWQSLDLGELVLTATPARHFSGRLLGHLRGNPTLWAGWAIQSPRHRVYICGDSGFFPGFREIGERLGPFDLSLIECGAYDALWPDVHLGPEQAVKAHALVRGGLLLPVHWGTFNLAFHGWTEPVERLLRAAQSSATPLVIPRPGESVDPASPAPLLRWWPERPWRTAQEDPIVSTGGD
ncbi:MAG: MBL fold metallo-hydrolase [Calditrichaeota bacterium]|nr:MBL fold metallo-hydrolase [Calditrichota bacterium]